MKRFINSFLAAGLILFNLSCGSTDVTLVVPRSPRPGVIEVAVPDRDQIRNEQSLYVPIYSQVYSADGASPINLAATLFVRNTDKAHSIIVTNVDFFDSGGKLIRSFLKKPMKLAPMATLDFFVKESDETGGASPGFRVSWVSTEVAMLDFPIVESVMIGTTGSQGISFVCPAKPLSK